MQIGLRFIQRTFILVCCLVIFTLVAQTTSAGVAQPTQADAPSVDQARKETEAIITQLRSDALEAKQRSDAALASPVWKSALTQKRESLLALEGEVDGFIGGLGSIADPLRAELPGLTVATRRLVALNEASQDNPVLQKVLFLRALQVSTNLGRQMRPLETVQSIANRATDAVQHLRHSLEEGTGTGSEEDKLARERVLSLDEKTRNLNIAVEKELVDAQALQQRLVLIQSSIIKELLPMWGKYYLAAPSRVFDVQAWQTMHLWWEQMLFNMPLRLSIEFPPTSAAWQGTGFNFINAMLLAVVVLFFVRIRLRTALAQGEITQSASRFILKSLTCFLVGIAVVLASFGSMEEQYRGLLTVGSIIAIFGEVWLAWGLRSRMEEQVSVPPLWPIAATSAAGIVLHYPNFPIILLTIFWALFVICLSILRKRQPRQPLPSLENGICQIHQVALYLSLAVALFGWGRLAILLVIGVNCLCISVQLIAGLMQMGRTSNEESSSAASGLVSAFIAPIVLFLVIGSMLLWMMAMPGGTLIAWHYLGTGVSIGQASFNLLNLFLLLSLFYLTRAAIAASRTLLTRWSERSKRVDTTLIPPMQTGIVYGLWTLFALFTLRTLGFGMENLAVIAGGLSVGIGFGMQAIVNNFLSGLILIFSRTLHEGDVIDVGNLQGTVRKISVRATTVETFDNAVIFVPNSEFVSNRLINWTRNGQHVRREVLVGVAYGTSPKLVEKLLMQVALSMDRVSRTKEPVVLFSDFSDSTLNFVLRFWSDFGCSAGLASEIRHKIVEVFAAENVEIAFPQLDVHIVSPKQAQEAATPA